MKYNGIKQDIRKQYTPPKMEVIEMNTESQLLCGSNSYHDDCGYQYNEPSDYYKGGWGEN